MLIDRRTLLRTWRALLGSVAALSALPAGLFFVWGARRTGPGGGSVEWIDLGLLDDVTEGAWSPRRFRRTVLDRWKTSEVDESVYLRRRGDAIEAVSSICPHAGCLVRKIEHGFGCPCHRSDFDEEGVPLSGPAPRPLDRLETRVEGKRLMLGFVRFRAGRDRAEPLSS